MTTVDITPNFKALRDRFEREAVHATNNAVRFMQRGESVPPETVRNLIVYLNVALQAVDTAEALNGFRDTFDKLMTAIVEADEKGREDPNKGNPLLADDDGVPYDDNY